MIKSFRHKGIKHFFETGNQSGIVTTHASKLRRQLAQLNVQETLKTIGQFQSTAIGDLHLLSKTRMQCWLTIKTITNHHDSNA